MWNYSPLQRCLVYCKAARVHNWFGSFGHELIKPVRCGEPFQLLVCLFGLSHSALHCSRARAGPVVKFFTFAVMTAVSGVGQICMLQQHTLRDFAWLCIQLGLSVACRVMPSLVGHYAFGTALDTGVLQSHRTSGTAMGSIGRGALAIGLLMWCFLLYWQKCALSERYVFLFGT